MTLVLWFFLDPVYMVPDSSSHDIDFGEFAVIFTLAIFPMIIAVIKFCNIIVNL